MLSRIFQQFSKREAQPAQPTVAEPEHDPSASKALGFRLVYKLLLVFSVAGAALAWVGYEYVSLNRVQTEARAAAEGAVRFDQLVSGSYLDYLDARRIEKEISLYGVEVSLAEHHIAVQSVLGRILQMTESSPSAEVGLHLGSLRGKLERYAELVREFGAAATELGLEPGTGLRAELQRSAVKVSSLTERTAATRLLLAVRPLERTVQEFLRDPSSAHVEGAWWESQFDAAMKAYSNEVNALSSDRAYAPMLREAGTRLAGDFARTLESAVRSKEAEWAILEQVQSIVPDFDNLRSTVSFERRAEGAALESSVTRSNRLFNSVLVTAGIVIALALVVLGVSVLRPVSIIDQTVRRVARGDYAARTELSSGDELGRLGRGFDQLLDERLSSLARAQQENEQLNASVIELLEAVAKISRKDLSIRVPVKEDITGPIADSLNLLNRETSSVLREVTNVGQELVAASGRIQQRARSVKQLSVRERQVVESTSIKLNESAAAMVSIAKLAQDCNAAAEQSARTTDAAQRSVAQTSEGIESLRELVSETSKRIKRLGERSQEIGQVVNVIGGIAERTHGLALNASMQAAAAGEAGRGLAVVAEEVQRLAENARSSTTQVAALVHNIQAETSDAVMTMNEVVSQVVNGTQLADRAGQDMEVTRRNTDILTRLVQNIARLSRKQAEGARALVSGAKGIREGAQQTSDRLVLQAQETEELVKKSRTLTAAISGYVLAEPRAAGTPRLAAVDNLPEPEPANRRRGSAAG